MKRLFEVVVPRTTVVRINGNLAKKGITVDGRWFFDNKEIAKEFRDDQDDRKVILGPDHWRFSMEPRVGRTHSHNMRSGGPGSGFKRKA